MVAQSRDNRGTSTQCWVSLGLTDLKLGTSTYGGNVTVIKKVTNNSLIVHWESDGTTSYNLNATIVLFRGL